ncbi:hypothetical protein C8P64_0801 [Christiangramia gaetbulicola]|uniref:Uncharacterized protein n=1 Tax=Christiangramia gaetbulicola TaxID=703340 RepID=A0A2T6ALX5_9FLAO|nr:hypothetical protein [Christiangramia gaetbulicola]PTX44819.1 hypothetical protein C8P64_0801 [Christiangramia gaetbulicola]
MNDNYTENNQAETGTEKRTAEKLPEFYSKRLILVFSGLFSILFGTVLLLSNLKKAGEKKGIYQVLIFVFIYVVGIIYTIQSVKAASNWSIPLNILGALILNEYFWNRYLGKDVEYEKKSWIKPAIISMCISIPAFLALVYLS